MQTPSSPRSRHNSPHPALAWPPTCAPALLTGILLKLAAAVASAPQGPKAPRGREAGEASRVRRRDAPEKRQDLVIGGEGVTMEVEGDHGKEAWWQRYLMFIEVTSKRCTMLQNKAWKRVKEVSFESITFLEVSPGDLI